MRVAGEKGECSALDVNGVTLLPAHATKRCYNRRRSPWNRKEWPDETSRTSCCWVLSRGWQRAPSIPSPHRSAHISTGTTVVAGEGTRTYSAILDGLLPAPAKLGRAAGGTATSE